MNSKPESKETILEVRDLNFYYGAFQGLKHINLNIQKNTVTAFIGPSGCGKTTTLRMVAGLEEPTKGSISLGSTDITYTKPYQRPINTVFQNYALFPHLSIFENIAFGLRRRGIKDVDDAVNKALADGWATGRTLIGSNEFYIVGPKNDPANIKTASSGADAYSKIAKVQAKFISRGDKSGTHQKEMDIWKKAGIAPEGNWYIVTNDFMTASLKKSEY